MVNGRAEGLVININARIRRWKGGRGILERENKRERMYWVMSTPKELEEGTRIEVEVRLKFDPKNVRAPRYGGCY